MALVKGIIFCDNAKYFHNTHPLKNYEQKNVKYKINITNIKTRRIESIHGETAFLNWEIKKQKMRYFLKKYPFHQ